jgi:hypothetical protein
MRSRGRGDVSPWHIIGLVIYKETIISNVTLIEHSVCILMFNFHLIVLSHCCCFFLSQTYTAVCLWWVMTVLWPLIWPFQFLLYLLKVHCQCYWFWTTDVLQVLLAIRSQGGEQALIHTLNRARELYTQRSQVTQSVDELASLLAQCAIAEAQ